MVRLDDGRYIIGFDNGYQFGKTARSLFDNGVHAMGKVEPSVMEHTLKHRRRFYKVGEGRAAITEDKVSDEDARLLTMAAVAKELSMEGIRKAGIVLAVGLPFSDYGREKGQFLEYYGQEPVLRFEFEGTRYDVEICRTLVFPQCYSAVAPRLGNMKGDYLVAGLSMPAYVKGLLRQHFKSAERAGTDVGVEACMERIREIVHGELACQGAVLAGTLEKIAEGFPERMKNAAQTGGPPESGEAFPGYSDSFPEGFDSVLERFM